MWCSAGSSTSWWRGRAPPGDPEAVRAVRAAAGTGRRRRDCPPRGRQARARRGRVGPTVRSSPSRAGAMAPSENSTAGDVVVLVVPCWSPSASLDERLGVLPVAVHTRRRFSRS